MDIAEYLNDHIAFAQKGRAVNWQEVAITVFNGMGQIIKERDDTISQQGDTLTELRNEIDLLQQALDKLGEKPTT